jgi:6-phosphogluconolactonase
VDLDISILETEAELINAAVSECTQVIQTKLDTGSEFNLALTGGTLGNAISKSIAEVLNKGDFSGLNIWWSDERYVPRDSTERNDLEFIRKLTNKNVKVHRANDSVSLSQAAVELANEISGRDMDLIILGMGPDGHIASLFPGKIHESENREVFAITDSPKPPAERLTFSLKKINSAKEVWLVASGENKADAVMGLVEGDRSLPVTHVNLSRLLVDSLAFGI